ncbi:MAG: serine/threonine-protein kinase [Luteitalea sp.]
MPWQVAGYETDADKPFDQGSFGTVWHGRRLTDGARVALKLVLKDHSADASERIEAERRGAMLQRSFHQAHGMVPAVFDLGYFPDGDLFIAMELIDGGALAEAIGAGPLDPHVAARHAAAICVFLEKAHSFSTTIEHDHYDRLVHADLKPGHIFARPSGEVIVLDFGIAKALDKATPLTTNNWGTSAYMSPERLLDGRVDEQVDFWSLGIILYEMLAGHRPYRALHAPSLKSQLEGAIRGNAPREPLPASVPPALGAVVSKLLAYQPEHRYSSATAIRADLQSCLDGATPSAFAEYDTPATSRVDQATTPMRGVRDRASDMATTSVPATDPLPAAHALSAGPGEPTLPFQVPPLPTPLPTPNSAALREPARPARSRRRRLARVIALLFAVYLGMSEMAGCVAAERFRQAIDGIDGPGLDTAESSYRRLASTGVLHLGMHMRVDRPLLAHLRALGTRVIEDYRQDQPSLSLADWKHAQHALRWARRIDPSDDETRATLRSTEAHILRITTRPGRSATTQAAYRRAIDRFREAARLDPDSFDPYLGISRIAVYGLAPADVDLASEAIMAAETRGYTPGRRERAQLGDGYLRRGDLLRREARTLSGQERTRALVKARADFQGCIDTFEPIVGFGLAAKNIETCKVQIVRVDEDLAEAIEKAVSW